MKHCHACLCQSPTVVALDLDLVEDEEGLPGPRHAGAMHVPEQPDLVAEAGARSQLKNNITIS